MSKQVDSPKGSFNASMAMPAVLRHQSGLVRHWGLVLLIRQPTFLGSFDRPSTRACPYGREDVPSSWLRTMTAFLPA